MDVSVYSSGLNLAQPSQYISSSTIHILFHKYIFLRIGEARNFVNIFDSYEKIVKKNNLYDETDFLRIVFRFGLQKRQNFT